MKIDMYKCDGCTQITDNPSTKKGWVTLSSGALDPVNISIAKGIYDGSCYKCFYRGRIQHFCSWECFKDFVMTPEKKKK